MFFFRSRPKRTLASFFPDGIDRHCHILPGVDDGAQSMEESLAIIREMKRAGLRGACCTPHIMSRFPNTPAALRAGFRELAARAAAEDFSLQLAAEYMIDEGFEATLRCGDLLLWEGQYLLVELPQYMLPPGWMDSLSLIRRQGITPILAHPERYGRILSPEDLVDLAEQGILFQGNTGSITGYYGKRTQALAHHLRDLNLYHCWGTDTHSLDMFQHATAKLLIG